MMKSLILFSVVILVAQAFSVEKEWQQFKLKHGKSYKSLLEEKRRFAIFQHNLNDIQEHNKKYANGQVTYWKTVTKFADLTQEEFKNFLTLKPKPKKVIKHLHVAVDDLTGLEEINYVEQGLVTPVKDQGECGSCWAMSTAGGIEGQYAKKTRNLVSMSAQHLVDCSYDNDGCDGGLMDTAYAWIKKNGIANEKEYPYKSTDGVTRTCKKLDPSTLVHITDFAQVVSGNEKALQNSLKKQGPISIAMDANCLSMYGGGVVGNSCGCDGDWPNHGVLLVGIGKEKDNSTSYLVKNSWGADWGLDGYFKLKVDENACGIANDASYPIL